MVLISVEELNEIRDFLKKKSNEKARESWKKFVPNAKKVYGVYLSDINKIVSKYKLGGFELVKKLWQDGYLEERILAAKILGRIAKEDPEKTLELIRKFVNDIDNWAVCDTLATQGIKSITGIKKDEIIEFSKKLIKSRNPWKQRFGIVLLVNFKKDPRMKKVVEGLLKLVKNDDYYVKKAVDWVRRSFNIY